MSEKEEPIPATPIEIRWADGTVQRSHMKLGEVGDRLERTHPKTGLDGHLKSTEIRNAEGHDVWIEIAG